MVPGEVIWEREMEWYLGLEKRDDDEGGGEGEDDDDDEDDDESKTSTLQTKTLNSQTNTLTSSIASATTTSLGTTTSTSSAVPISSTLLQRTSQTVSTTPITSTTSTTVKSTLLTSIITTPASITPTQKGKGNTSTTSIFSKASATNTASAQGVSSPSSSRTPSKTTINIAIGVGAIALLLLALFVFFYRKSFRKLFISFYKKRKTSATDATRSIWRGESMMTAATSPDAPRSVYIPPRSLIQQPPLVLPLRLNPQKGGERIMSNITVERQERLGLVRDLPPSKELDDIRARKEMNQELEDKGSIGLARGSGIVDEKDKVEIEASTGMWEESEIIAKRDSGTESEASLPRWRAPVSWVRDQRMRGWGRLSG